MAARTRKKSRHSESSKSAGWIKKPVLHPNSVQSVGGLIKCLFGGMVLSLAFSVPARAGARYVSPAGRGTACSVGTPCLPSYAAASPGNGGPVQAGDAIHIVASGIVRADSFTFGPAGTSPGNMTLWTADPGVRIIFTSTTNRPPTINLPRNLQL